MPTAKAVPPSKLKEFSQQQAIKVRQVERKIKQLQKEYIELQNGIYDKPLAPEMQEVYAKAAYLCSANAIEASMLARVPRQLINAWVREKGWDIERQQLYDKVRLRMEQYLEENVVDYKASFAVKVWKRANELLDAKLDDNEMSPLDQANAIEKLASLALQLQGDSMEKEDDGRISSITQNILVNFQQKSLEQSDGEDDVIDIDNLEDELLEIEDDTA